MKYEQKTHEQYDASVIFNSDWTPWKPTNVKNNRVAGFYSTGIVRTTATRKNNRNRKMR